MNERQNATPRARIELTEAEFESVVGEALESLPKRFSDRIDNIAIAIEDEPTDADLTCVSHDAGEHTELLGMYRGVALTRRTLTGGTLFPDEIALFRGPINRVSQSRLDAVRHVRETVLHELGHYFGLNDDEMPF